MKFFIDRKTLYEVLSQIQGLTDRKTSLAITSDVLIKASGSEITITANNFQTVFQGKYEAEVESDGIISINSRKLYEITKEYPDSKILLNEIENRWVEIGEGNIQYHIVSSDSDKFTENTIMDDIVFIDINISFLKKMIEISSIINFSREEKRIYVLGVLIEKISRENKNYLRMISTDSRRLTCIDVEYKGEFINNGENIIVPKKCLSEIGSIFRTEGDIKIGIKDDYLIIKKDSETIMIKLLAGEFPDYKYIINIEDKIPIEMDRNMFLSMMKRMSILTSDDYRSVIFSFKENNLVVTLTNPEIGESKEEIDINYQGDFVETAFNPRYFIDALKTVKSDTIVMYIKDSRNPCVIKGIDDDKLICAVMPMFI